MSGFNCLTAPGVAFATKNDFTAHYRSEWHRYNLKRRTASLAMVSEGEFERRRAAAADAAPPSKQDAHVKQDKREKRSKRRELKGATIKDAVPGYRSALNVSDGPAARQAEVVEVAYVHIWVYTVWGLGSARRRRWRLIPTNPSPRPNPNPNWRRIPTGVQPLG